MLDEPLQGNLAAIDLGSNSFHMVIGRVIEGRVHLLDRLREPVRLAAGLNSDGRLDEVSRTRALACLSRFGERLRDLPSSQVRAVGTNTLRKASNTRSFLHDASRALGHPIEILPGREEARLIYQGVANSVPKDDGNRLVVDIGGGSTECIIGREYEALQADSLYMGCVGFSVQFFADGKITKDRFESAKIAAELEAQSIAKRFKKLGWQNAFGASGTIKAIDSVVRENGWSDMGITAPALKKLRKALVSAGTANKLTLAGLDDDRRPVIAGGAAILFGVFEQLGVEQMTVSTGALREGLLYTMLDHDEAHDPREHTINEFCERYSVDMQQAARVEKTAVDLLNQVEEDWKLDSSVGRQILRWASRLHEVGLVVNYSGFRKHGAYLVANSDMPGFSRDGVQLLSVVIQSHRRKLDPALFAGLPEAYAGLGEKLTVLLRLAVLLNRTRTSESTWVPEVRAKTSKVKLKFPEGWLDAHPLTRADLCQEAEWLRALDLKLTWVDGGA